MFLIRRTRLPLAAAPTVFALALVLAACAPGQRDSSETLTNPVLPSSSPTSSSASPTSPSASPTSGAASSLGQGVAPHPAANPPLALSELRITTRGLLPLTHSDPIVGNAGESLVTWDNLACYFPGDGATENTGRWVAAYAGQEKGAFSNDGHIDGSIHRIDIWTPTIATPEGVHIGTTRADLEATYPELVTGLQVPGDFGVFWIADEDGYVVFETITRSQGGTMAEFVGYIRILAPSVDPDFAIEGTDDDAGGCNI